MHILTDLSMSDSCQKTVEKLSISCQSIAIRFLRDYNFRVLKNHVMKGREVMNKDKDYYMSRIIELLDNCSELITLDIILNLLLECSNQSFDSV